MISKYKCKHPINIHYTRTIVVDLWQSYILVLLQGGRLLIRLGDSDIDYDKNFKYVIPFYSYYLKQLLKGSLIATAMDLANHNACYINDLPCLTFFGLESRQ